MQTAMPETEMGILLSVVLMATSMAAPPSPSSSPNLAGIAHVAFRVTDLSKSRDFYGKLGFEEAFGFSDPGKSPVSYLKVNDRQYIELYQRANDSQSLGLMHVCYEAADIDSLREYYVQHGVETPPSKKAHAGNLLFVFHDPDNMVVEFTQYMPGSLHYEARGKHLSEHRISEHMLRPALPVKDVDAERSFYATKLGFEDLGKPGRVRLRLPGDSGEEIEFTTSTPETKPRVVFRVADVKRAAKELESRGLSPRVEQDTVSVTDPDGTLIVFSSGEQSH
jgi:catechol 2,3-dioxygenase-like lactoylglutathione lyase family enzyme